MVVFYTMHTKCDNNVLLSSSNFVVSTCEFPKAQPTPVQHLQFNVVANS